MDDSSSAGDAPSGPTRVGRPPISRLLTFIILAAVGGGADLWTKHVIFDWMGPPGISETYWIIDGYFGIQTAVNIGAVFGIGAGQGTVFAGLSIVAGIGIFLWLFKFGAADSRWLTVALGMVSGGIIGNLYDRLGLWWQADYPEPWKSGVRDWILWQANDQWRWPNFNIADSLLVVGAVMLFYHSMFLVPPETADSDPTSATDPNVKC